MEQNFDSRYVQAAMQAWCAAEEIEGIESGGIDPPAVWAKPIACQDDGEQIIVTLQYKLPERGGLCGEYHVTNGGQIQETVYTFQNGEISRDGQPIFNEPGYETKESNQIKRTFFMENKDIITHQTFKRAREIRLDDIGYSVSY